MKRAKRRERKETSVFFGWEKTTRGCERASVSVCRQQGGARAPCPFSARWHGPAHSLSLQRSVRRAGCVENQGLLFSFTPHPPPNTLPPPPGPPSLPRARGARPDCGKERARAVIGRRMHTGPHRTTPHHTRNSRVKKARTHTHTHTPEARKTHTPRPALSPVYIFLDSLVIFCLLVLGLSRPPKRRGGGGVGGGLTHPRAPALPSRTAGTPWGRAPSRRPRPPSPPPAWPGRCAGGPSPGRCAPWPGCPAAGPPRPGGSTWGPP